MVRKGENSGSNGLAGASGFTLVEVMIALVVLMVGLLALAQLQVAMINSLAYSRHYSVATQLAEGQMEKLMSYPCSELYANSVNYYPQNDSGASIVALDSSGTTASPLHDGITTQIVSDQTIGNGDGKAARLWMPSPINELGQPAKSNENSYLVTWTVERGGSEGTPGPTDKTYYYWVKGVPVVSNLGIPGPYQVRLVVTAIWFEKGQKLTANSDHASFVDTNGNFKVACNRSTIEGMRELSSAKPQQ